MLGLFFCLFFPVFKPLPLAWVLGLQTCLTHPAYCIISVCDLSK